MEDRLGLHLRFAQNQLFREIAAGFAPFDVTPLLFSILTLVEANPGCRQSDIGAALGVKPPNLAERIDTLVRRGLLGRTPDDSDRRANVLALTPAGKRMLARLKAVDETVSQGFVARLGADDHALLINLLKRLMPTGT